MKKIILLVVVLSTFFTANATHLMGGEITWSCIKDPLDPDVGKYIFTLKVYRDCTGTTLPSGQESIQVWNGGGAGLVDVIPVFFISATDISPQCQFINPLVPPLDCYGANNDGAVEENVWISQPYQFPAGSIIPATGWHFTWDLCCRNGALNNLQNPGSAGFTLRSSMFPYFNPVTGVQTPPDPCFDSSPIFNEIPKTIICTGYPFAYSHNASDPELDSIRYDWAEPLDWGFATYDPNPANNSPGAVPFVAPYSFNSPLPGNPNLDPITGEISYNSPIAGFFATVIKVDAYKCGQKVASMYRDIQAVLKDCDTNFINNNQPIVTAPVPPVGTQTWTIIPNGAILPSYETTVNSGDLITFDIVGEDLDVYPNGVPQDLFMEISGGQMAADYVTNFLCENPPCATFTDLAGNPPPLTAPSMVSGVFTWQTDCNQILSDAGCGATTNIFTFLVKVYDDFCPANAITIATMKIEMLPALPQSAPLFKCVTESMSGDISITWDHSVPSDPSTIYYIYGADNISGPYSLLTTAPYPNNSCIINSINIPPGIEYYYMKLSSLCATISGTSDTIMPVQFDINSTNINCWEDIDGRIAINMISNVITPFTYYLDTVPNPNAYPLDSVWDNLPAGTYNITISDNANCIIEEQITISAPGFPLQALVSVNSDSNVCYGSSDGFLVGSGAGGTPGYTYEWFDDTYTSFSVGSGPSDTAFGLSAGIYSLVVIDANGCDTSTSAQVLGPQAALSGSPDMFLVACKGESTGMVVGNAQGGWAPYQYFWMDSNGDTLQQHLPTFTRDTLSGLSIGVYTLHVYDVQDCFVDYTITMSEPSTSLSIDSMAVIDSIACYGDSIGKAILYASGGWGNYSYLWDNGETNTTAYALTSGWHSVLLSDYWGCEVSGSIYISENPEIESQISTIQNVSCYGGGDGIASITSVGGDPGYIYFWSNDPIGHTTMPDIVTGLSHGSYYVTTQDVLGCEVIDSIYISEPEPLSMEASELDWIDCLGYNNGLAYATASGGTAPYTFVWDNGQWTGDTINTLTPGLHTVVVTDARGCSATDTVFTHEPTKLIIEIDSTQTVLAYCIGVSTASLTGVASGGTPGYSYEWDDNITTPQTTATASSLLAGEYTVTATDIKGCIASYTIDIDTTTNTMDAGLTSLVQYIGGNDVSCFGEDDAEAIVTAWGAYSPYVYQWYGPNSFNSNNASIANLVAGTYSVIVTDVNNCTVNRSIVITEPNEIYFTTLSATDESCLGACNGDMQVSVTGGVAPYTGLATENTTGNTITSLMANDSVVPGMCSGTYILTITDTNNCPSSVINGGVNQQTIGTSVFTATTIDPATITNVDCYGMATGVLQALNPNTAPGYSYSWENINNPGTSISNTTQAINLMAGDYILYAYYADTTSGQNYEGCTTTDIESITQLAVLQAHASITNVDCYNNANGSITLSPTGGQVPYLFSWDTISIPVGSSQQDQSSLQSGTYILTITDSINNCQVADTFEITQPPVLSVNVGQNGYTLTATPTGGTAPFSYSWRNSSNTHLQSGATYTVIDYGSYYVVATDANGCEVTSSPPITFTFTASWDCIAQACIDPGNGSGAYSLLSACNTACTSTGVEESLVFEVSIYPNPFREETTVDFGMEIKEAIISVVDVYGKKIESYYISNTNKHILKRNNKASGIYFVEIKVGAVKLFTKIIIE